MYSDIRHGKYVTLRVLDMSESRNEQNDTQKIMSLSSKTLLRVGRRKQIYVCPNTEEIILGFIDDTHKVSFNTINAKISEIVKKCRIPMHYISRVSSSEFKAYNVNPFPFYVRITNIVNQPVHTIGDMRIGAKLSSALVEFMTRTAGTYHVVSASYLCMLDWCESHYLDHVREYSVRVNDILTTIFFKTGKEIASLMLRFGLFKPAFNPKQKISVMLINDFAPDQFELWDPEVQALMPLDDKLVQSIHDMLVS